MRLPSIIVPLILLLGLAACDHKPTATAASRIAAPKTVTVSATEIIHLSDPNGDLAAALARQVHRLVGIMGVGLSIPGIPPEQQSAMLKKYGVKTIDGITDVNNARSEQLRKPATKYAQKYNTGLLMRLEER